LLREKPLDLEPRTRCSRFMVLPPGNVGAYPCVHARIGCPKCDCFWSNQFFWRESRRITCETVKKGPRHFVIVYTPTSKVSPQRVRIIFHSSAGSEHGCRHGASDTWSVRHPLPKSRDTSGSSSSQERRTRAGYGATTAIPNKGTLPPFPPLSFGRHTGRGGCCRREEICLFS